MYFVKGENYLNKETTINEWMRRDQAKDEKLENAIESKGVRCLHCNRPLTNCTSRDLMTDSKNNEEAVFMFECDKCHKRRSYWENGIEWRPKPVLCEKCNSEMKSSYNKKGSVIETIYRCPECHHETTFSYDLSEKKKLSIQVLNPSGKSTAFQKKKALNILSESNIWKQQQIS